MRVAILCRKRNENEKGKETGEEKGCEWQYYKEKNENENGKETEEEKGKEGEERGMNYQEKGKEIKVRV